MPCFIYNKRSLEDLLEGCWFFKADIIKEKESLKTMDPYPLDKLSMNVLWWCFFFP